MGTTTHYSWTKPTNGADADTWGLELNTTLDDIDAQMFLAATKADPAFTGTATGAALSFTGNGAFGGTFTATGASTLTGNVSMAGTLAVTGVITATAGVTGNASTATALATGRTISITGDLAYTSASFTGAGNVTGAGTLATVNSTTGDFYPAKMTVNGKGLVTSVTDGGTLQAQNLQTAGTNSGETIASVTWTKRTLNTTVSNSITGASIASSQITLPAGSYKIDASAAYDQTGGTNGAVKLRLRNTTDSTTPLVGISQPTLSTGLVVANLSGLFAIAGTKVMELDMYSSSSASGNGGDHVAAASGESEIFVNVVIVKVG